MPKKLKGGAFSLCRYGMLRGKRGKTFLVQFAWPNDSIWHLKFRRTFKNYFGQFVWNEKSHYNSRVSLHDTPTKNKNLLNFIESHQILNMSFCWSERKQE